MKSKILLPVLAVIFGTAMSFTTADFGKEKASDYIRVNNQWMPIQEIDCGSGANLCQVRLGDGSVHKVYDTKNFNSLKNTNKNKPIEL